MSMLIKTLAAVAADTALATTTLAQSTIRGDSCRLRENAIKRIFAKGWIADSSRC